MGIFSSLSSAFVFAEHWVEQEAHDLVVAGESVLNKAETVAGGFFATVEKDAGPVGTALLNFARGVEQDFVSLEKTAITEIGSTARNLITSGANVAVHTEDMVGDAFSRVGDVANNFVNKGTGILSTPLVVIAGGIAVALYVAAQNPQGTAALLRA